MEKEKSKTNDQKKKKKKKILFIIIGLIVIAITTTFIIILNSNKDSDSNNNNNDTSTKEEAKKNSVEEELLSDIKYNIETSELNNIKLEKTDGEKYNLSFDYNKDIMLLHVCAEDSQSFINRLISKDVNNIELIQSIRMNCKENNSLKYIVIINNFNNVDSENLEENTILYDENETAINKTVSQTKEEFVKEYKNSCQTYDYKTIFRYAEDYKGKDVKYTGKVVQVIEGALTSYRVNVTKDKWGYYDDTIYVTDMGLDKTVPRILEDDIITFYGTLGNLYTYETVRGTTVTIPSVTARYIELKE